MSSPNKELTLFFLSHFTVNSKNTSPPTPTFPFPRGDVTQFPHFFLISVSSAEVNLDLQIPWQDAVQPESYKGAPLQVTVWPAGT